MVPATTGSTAESGERAKLIAWLDSLQDRGMKFRLDAMFAALERMGRPHERAPVLHVGGTNGKGSVVAFATAILRAAGYRVGTYTSPHLVDLRERILVDGQPIPEERLLDGIRRIRPIIEEVERDGTVGLVTYFEALTLLAYWWFAESRVDVQVIEVGLGGRLDATNVHAKPLATVITNISLEHTKLLGDTIPAIAREKAGILRPGVPFVTAAQGEALAFFRGEAARLGTPLRVVGEDLKVEPLEATRKGQDALFLGTRREYGECKLALVGEHQLANAGCAVAACEAMDAAGFRVPVEAVVQGLARARWPGRLQWIRERPGLLLDGAHNPAGTEALAGYLEAEQLKPTLVYGCLGDKDWPRMVQSLAPHVRQAIVVAPPSDRALDPRELGSAFARGGVVATVAADVPHALAIAKAQTSPDGVVLVAGSLYLIGDVLRVLGEAGV